MRLDMIKIWTGSALNAKKAVQKGLTPSLTHETRQNRCPWLIPMSVWSRFRSR